MSMREVGTCRNQDCGQTDLLWEDGFCTEECRAEVTGCEVPSCTCAGGCSMTIPADQSPKLGGPT